MSNPRLAWDKRLMLGFAKAYVGCAAFVFLCCSCSTERMSAPLTLRVAMVGPLDALTADPIQGYSGLAQEWVFEQLVRVNEDGTLAPALAQQLERRGRGLHFALRPGAVFSDGLPVGTSDVIESLARHSLVGRADDSGILVEPPANGATIDAALPFVVVGRRRPRLPDLGSGPFRIEKQQPTRIVLQRIRPDRRRIQTIELLGFATPREAIARTLAGDADLLPRVEPRLAELFQGVDRLRLTRGRSTQAAIVAFSMSISRPQRRALAEALSGGELGRTAFGNACTPWSSGTSAKGSLSAGPKLDVVSPRLDVGYERLALAVRRALGSRGGQVLDVSIQEAVQAWVAGRFQLLASPALIWPPGVAASKFRSDSKDNLWHYSDPAVDAALDREDWKGAFHALSENPPLAFICLQERLVAVDSRIKEPKLGPLTLLEFVPEWEVGP